VSPGTTSKWTIAGVLSRVLTALARRVGQHRRAQDVLLERVGAPHRLVAHRLDRQLGVPACIHADLEHDHDIAGVLADRPVTLGTHARVDQDLRQCVLGGGRLLALVGGGHCLHEIGGVVVGNELQRVGDALDEVFLLDGSGRLDHGGLLQKSNQGAGAAQLPHRRNLEGADGREITARAAGCFQAAGLWRIRRSRPG
jgi:hypothetical protein